MFDKVFSKMLDKEEITRETIQDTLQDLVIELNCQPWELAISIEPLKEVKIPGSNGGETKIDSENKLCKFVCYVYQIKKNEKGLFTRQRIREITLKEILTGENE